MTDTENLMLARADAISKAETAIQRILIDLQDEIGRKIESIEVDTRNYANYSVTIFEATP